MAQSKELYTEHGEKWVMETNDFWYYMHLKKQKVPTKYTGSKDKLLTLWRDITDFLHEVHDINIPLCKTPHLCSKDHDSMDDDWY